MQAMQAALDAMPVRRKLQRSNSYDRDVHDAALALQTDGAEEDTPKHRASIALSLGYRSLYESNQVSKVLPTALVGTVLMLHNERGLRMSELVERVRWVQQQVVMRGGRVSDDSMINVKKSVYTVVDRIMSSRRRGGDLVKRHKELLVTGVFTPEERMELSIFRNQLIHIFVMEGLIACGIYQVLHNAPTASKVVKRAELQSSCAFLSTILKLEFIFKPSEVRSIPAIEANFNLGLKRIFDSGMVQEDGDNLIVDDLTLAVAREGNKHQLNREGGIFTFLCSLFCPFVDSYWLAAVALHKLLQDELVTEDAMVAHAQVLGEKLYFDSQLDHYEAIAKETMTNAFFVYGEMGIIERVKVEGQQKKAVQLSEEYRDEAKLQALVQRIQSYSFSVGGRPSVDLTGL